MATFPALARHSMQSAETKAIHRQTLNVHDQTLHDQPNLIVSLFAQIKKLIEIKLCKHSFLDKIVFKRTV
jgi:hypothetical protein